MHSVPPRNPFLMLASMVVALVGGPALGSAVAHWAAPGSGLAQLVSPAAFALAFVGGLLLWFGLGAVTLIASGLSRLLRGQWGREHAAQPGSELVPSGYGAFLPLALGFGLLAGVVAGLSPQSTSFGVTCIAHVAAGGAYGALLRGLAHHGYLPFPEPA